MSQEFEAKHREALIEYLTADKNTQELFEFDLWAQDPNDFDLPQGWNVLSAGGILPFQAEGHLKDYYFYLRSEDGDSSLRVAAIQSEVYLNPLWTSTITEETNKINLSLNLQELAGNLEKAPFYYQFEGLGMKKDREGKWIANPDETVTMGARAHSAEEAYREIFICLPYFLDRLNLTPDTYRELMMSRKFSHIPLEEDNRIYPERMDIY